MCTECRIVDVTNDDPELECICRGCWLPIYEENGTLHADDKTELRKLRRKKAL